MQCECHGNSLNLVSSNIFMEILSIWFSQTFSWKFMENLLKMQCSVNVMEISSECLLPVPQKKGLNLAANLIDQDNRHGI